VTATAELPAVALPEERHLAYSLFGEPAPYPPEPEPAGVPVADLPPQDQLVLPFGPPAHQPSIWDAEPAPCQLALLPEPEPWEAEGPAAPRTPASGRLARRRARPAPGRGQLPLF
jgi:hypothetical protein